MGRRGQEVRRESRLSAGAHVALAAIVIVAALAASPARADFTGRVVSVHDGDTLTVLADGRPRRVRLAGIDAPEHGQPFGQAARGALRARVAGRTVHVVERGRDAFGRVLARVFVEAVDVNAEQVRSGYAWVYRRYGNDARLLALEAEAKAARRGLWREREPVPPWQWRERDAGSPLVPAAP